MSKDVQAKYMYSNVHLVHSDEITVNPSVFTYLIQIIAEQCKRHVIKLVKTTTHLDNNLSNTSNNPAFVWNMYQVVGHTHGITMMDLCVHYTVIANERN